MYEDTSEQEEIERDMPECERHNMDEEEKDYWDSFKK